VTFIDILGFRAIVEDVYRDKPEPVSALLDAFVAEQLVSDPQSFLGGTAESPYSPNHVISLSDSVIRIAYLPEGVSRSKKSADIMQDKEGVAKAIGYEVEALRRMQRMLATKRSGLEDQHYPGVLIRGGLAVGDIFYNQKKNQLFGPAMNAAVALERKAVTPRIIIDPSAMHTYREAFDLLTSNGSVANDDDGSFYVDYFAPAVGGPSDPAITNLLCLSTDRFDYSLVDIIAAKAVAVRHLDSMRDVLCRRLKTHAGDDTAILEKLRWMAVRHNRAVGRTVEAFSLRGEEAAGLYVELG